MKINQKVLSTLRCAEVFAAHLGVKNQNLYDAMSSACTVKQVDKIYSFCAALEATREFTSIAVATITLFYRFHWMV